MSEVGKSLWVRSLYGYHNREPLVAITMPGGETLMISPEDARHHAQNVIQCAEAAEQDAFIFEWAARNVPGGEKSGAALLNEFRKWREERLKEAGWNPDP